MSYSLGAELRSAHFIGVLGNEVIDSGGNVVGWLYIDTETAEPSHLMLADNIVLTAELARRLPGLFGLGDTALSDGVVSELVLAWNESANKVKQVGYDSEGSIFDVI